jgi:site-specific recombinase XerD
MTFNWQSEFVAAQRVRSQALRDHIETFATALGARGYAKSTTKEHVRLVAGLGRWLDRRKMTVADLDERCGAEFIAYLRRRGRAARSHRTAVRILLSVLRESGVVRSPCTMGAQIEADPVTEIERAFEHHLAEERGLHPSTRSSYIRIARRLLSGRARGGTLQLGELCPDDVTRFVTNEARARPMSAKLIGPALRVLLRWLHQRGDTAVCLVGCVPPVADWRLSSLPKALPADQVERLLQKCDRNSMVGRRDHAILLLLARLGLRAGEVVAMELEDLSWESGGIVVRSKGGRQDDLPLPRDVGSAVADYLRHGRPRCSTRRVFVRARAPHQGFASSVAICNIVERALKRAGLEPPRKGAHTLRHALACTMLRHGASLAEIGQILRHRSPDTTAIYAKVDLVSLRALAPAWPQLAGEP